MKLQFGLNSVSGSRRSRQDNQVNSKSDPEDRETGTVIFCQVFVPFLVAGFANVASGIILDHAQRWSSFQAVTELFILVTALLGFKGNLEMCLSARLATQANLGKLDDRKTQCQVAIGNMALMQVQSIAIASLAALIAVAVNYGKDLHLDTSAALIIGATSLFTASTTGFLLVALMVVITIISRNVGVNPDNVSTLIAAFLGDISAVALLCGSANFFFICRHNVWLAPAVIGFFILLLPVALAIARRNEFTHDVVGTGWFPIIIAMCISSVGGFIFDFGIGIFETIAVFQPIINGVGNNLIAVQASRISTYLHQRDDRKSLPAPPTPRGATCLHRCNVPSHPAEMEGQELQQNRYCCQSPFTAFFGRNPHVRVARLLLLMSVPGHVIYIVAIRCIKPGEVFITLPFVAFYLLTDIVQLIILLYLAHLLVPFLWRKKIDPDNAAIPVIMGVGDLIGTMLLTAAYFALQALQDPNVSQSYALAAIG